MYSNFDAPRYTLVDFDELRRSQPPRYPEVARIWIHGTQRDLTVRWRLEELLDPCRVLLHFRFLDTSDTLELTVSDVYFRSPLNTVRQNVELWLTSAVNKRLTQPKEGLMKGRFDYIRYDEHSQRLQQRAKKLCMEIESLIEKELLNPDQYKGLGEFDRGLAMREAAIAMTELEALYARIGRAIRNHQMVLRGPCEDQPERGDP